MKKILFVLVLLLGTTSFAQSFEWGPKFGLNIIRMSLSDLENPYIGPEFSPNEIPFSEGNNTIGNHIGIYTKVQLSGFYIQQEFLFTQIKAERFSEDFITGGAALVTKDISINRIDIPILVGKRILKNIRIQAGPIFSIPISNKFGWNDKYNRATIGYQTGLGINIDRLMVDLKYEGSFNKIEENFGGYPTTIRLSQIILSLGIKL